MKLVSYNFNNNDNVSMPAKSQNMINNSKSLWCEIDLLTMFRKRKCLETFKPPLSIFRLMAALFWETAIPLHCLLLGRVPMWPFAAMRSQVLKLSEAEEEKIKLKVLQSVPYTHSFWGLLIFSLNHRFCVAKDRLCMTARKRDWRSTRKSEREKENLCLDTL